MDNVNETPEYKSGYSAGYSTGYSIGVANGARYDNLKARWRYVKGEWFCSNCGTKHEQKHDEYCCKCGAKMDEEEAC